MMRNLSIAIIIIISIAQISFAQKRDVYLNENYNFQFSLPDGWQKPKIEETNKKDVISYSFEHKKDTTAQILLLAFKMESVKDLDNFIYVL
jgi:hypothetical protein